MCQGAERGHMEIMPAPNLICRLPLIIALLSASVFAQENIKQIQQKTSGACSPAIVNNSGSIVINCGPDSEELVRILNEFLANSSKEEIMVTLRRMREDLAWLRKANSGPRKELANLGISWTSEAFGEALQRGDTRVLKLFLAGGMDLYGEYDGGYAIAKFISVSHSIGNFKEIFQLLMTYKLDVDHELKAPLSAWKSLAEHAVAAGSVEAFQLIWDASKERETIRTMVRAWVAEEQMEQRRAHPLSVRSVGREEGLLKMLLIAESDNTFLLRGHEVRYETGASGRASPKSRLYDGPDGWFLLLDTTSLVREVTYEINGHRRTVERTTRLPIELSELGRALTPVRIEMVDAIGRIIGPITVDIDFEDLKR